ncbi:MAG: UvrB/UvrC motif-containing protein [Phycisphaerales bacterium]|nr:UvrB/UvrC motif-containing protein [Phycisphaerales bacterium]
MKRRKATSGLFDALDITQALDGWAFEPGQVNVRLIRGNDGKVKLQMRLDLGLLQMEVEGRPDGKRPHRAATELDFQKRKLSYHRKKFGSDAGFRLMPRDCQLLREESAMFYHRYLSMFVLEQYQAVIRDTQHNMEVLDFCNRYGGSDCDRHCMEQYRAYILMMNTRAKACAALRQGYVQTAIAYLRGGIRQVAHLFPKEDRRKLLRQCNEAAILLDMLRQIRAKLPAHPREILQRRLSDAVANERFEEAAKLRDRLAAMKDMMKPATEMPKEGTTKRSRKLRQRREADDAK